MQQGDATDLATALRCGRISPAAVMEATLAAVERLDRLGAVARCDPALGRQGALDADTGTPFAGQPFLAKDLGAHARGLAIGAGNAALQSRPPQAQDSVLFQRFRNAGLVPFGLSTVPEFGLALTSEPPAGPVVRNPWDETLSPGGSSGGAAAAVAAGIVAIAHATDAAGSIRVPAACCGLVGLKPGRGAIPGGPDHANHLMGLASELVLARSVRDVRTAFLAVSDAPRDRTPLRSAAILAPDGLGDAEARGLDTARARLEQAGMTCRTVPATALARLGADAGGLARLILSTALAEWLDAAGLTPAEVSPLSAKVASEGRAVTGPALLGAARRIEQIADEVAALLADTEVLVLPVLANGLPKIGSFAFHSTDTDAHFAQMQAVAPNAALANVAGLPALSLPMVEEPGTLPASVQMLTHRGGELALLDLAETLQDSAPRLRFPYPLAGLTA